MGRLPLVQKDEPRGTCNRANHEKREKEVHLQDDHGERHDDNGHRDAVCDDAPLTRIGPRTYHLALRRLELVGHARGSRSSIQP